MKRRETSFLIVRVYGGLGNQLFQYAFGKYLSIKFKTALKLDNRTNLDENVSVLREYLLYQLSIDTPIADRNDLGQFVLLKSGILYRIFRKVIRFIPILGDSYNLEPYYNAPQRNRISYYDGYWQNHCYADSIREHLIENIKLSCTISAENKKWINIIKRRDSVSIHIRRSDYKLSAENRKLFADISPQYYHNAIKKVLEINKNTNLIFFSDDMGYVRKEFECYDAHFVDCNIGDPVMDLYLMSICTHNIIANSTFSWWAAWLNQNNSKTIIAPRDWYTPDYRHLEKRLIPPRWIRM